MGKEIRLKAQWSLYQGWGSKPVFSRPNDALPVASGSRTLSRYFSNMIEMPEDRSLLLALGQTVGINLRPLIRMHSGRYGNFEALVAQQQAELEGEESPGHNWENKEVQAQLKRIKKKYARQEKTILRWEAEAYMETSSFILLIQNWLESIQHNPEFYRMLDLSQFSLNEAEKKSIPSLF
ncbi:MAG: hypothetical protein HC880_12560 [Bacteroidia bacterium]|nr:hypothetical protein [Bacteroidia bacterium]